MKTPGGSTVNFQAGLTCRDNDGIDVHRLLRERERGKRRRVRDIKNVPSPPQIFIKDHFFKKIMSFGTN